MPGLRFGKQNHLISGTGTLTFFTITPLSTKFVSGTLTFWDFESFHHALWVTPLSITFFEIFVLNFFFLKQLTEYVFTVFCV